ncbi:cobaltochelatase CobT-related protein [Paenalcaligenes sp. Me131]|uniref:cobaltochelatase CobT-related protein n=1 Tax=Paenalcaligenes sp. Me131 TaxID=3392636 RepID=UPI003D293FA9
MNSPTPDLREQRRVLELSAMVTRALADDPHVHIRQQLFFRENRPLVTLAPHLRVHDSESLQHLRGVADSLALRLLHTQHALHQQLMPADAVSRLIFDWLEALRTESLAPESMPGMRHNLQQRFYFWSAGYYHARHTESELGIWLYTLAQMCWSRLNALPVYPETEDFIESTRASLTPVLGPLLYELRKHRTDQASYATYALRVAALVHHEVEAMQKAQSESGTDTEDDQEWDNFSLLLDFDGDEAAAYDEVLNDTTRSTAMTQEQYQVFDNQYDKEEHLSELIRPELLNGYREQINQRISHQNLHINLLIQRLRRVLTQYSDPRWENDQESGYIDGARLSQIISNPNERRLFRQPTVAPHTPCSISFLVDCSGSMKHHAETVTLMVDILSRALEQAGAQTEVLGFSTHAWNGGRPFKRWMARQRPAHPGRLNEVSHRVFKAAKTPWKRANRDIVALMKLDYYREGIDGEAVQWACQRLQSLQSQRKILYVLSDGCPMDSATNLGNNEHYLENHLLQVLDSAAQQGIEVWGIGIGLDLSRLYTHSLIADFEHGLDNHFLDDFVRSLRPTRLGLGSRS